MCLLFLFQRYCPALPNKRKGGYVFLARKKGIIGMIGKHLPNPPADVPVLVENPF